MMGEKGKDLVNYAVVPLISGLVLNRSPEVTFQEITNIQIL